MEIAVGTWLDCGCCGMGFQTWEGYEDQDQDQDYGICEGCQFDLVKHNEAAYDDLIACLRKAYTPENLKKFDAYDRDTQKAMAYRALEKGQITVHIGAR